MQALKKFYFGKQKAKVNTYIGGIGGTINTPALLASKLDIAENRIKLFKVTGVDVECAITKGSQFDYNFNERVELIGITYYYDNDGYVKNIASTGIGGGANFFKGYFPGIINQIGIVVFQDRPIGYRIEMPNCISLPNLFTGNYSGVTGKVLVVPKCTSFGTDKLNNSVFTSGGGAQGLKVYAPISEQTSNSGSVEGDLNYVLSVGSSVVYVTNFTPPNAITNLSTGTIYNTAVQLNFTPPTSVNGVDFYEVYINGERFNTREIKNSGEFITGLTPSTNYNIRIVAVDMFYNKSELSNTVNVSTTNRVATDTDAISYVNASANTIYQDIIDDMFLALKTQGLYAKIQSFYPFLGTTSAQHKWNAKNPLDTNAAFRLVFSGDGIFSNSGYLTNGSNTYANTFYNPTGKITAASSGITIVTGTNNIPVGTQIFDIGTQKNNPNYDGLVIQLKNGASKNQISGRIGLYPQGEVYQNSVSDSRGIVSVVSQGLSLRKIFRNGILKSTATTTTTEVMPNYNLFIGSLNNGGSAFSYSNQRIQFTAIHEGLTDAEVVALHTIIDNFESVIGRKTW